MVVSAVPSASYKVKTEWLKDGCVCVNVSAEKNFDKDVRDKVCWMFHERNTPTDECIVIHLHACSRQSDHLHAA